MSWPAGSITVEDAEWVMDCSTMDIQHIPDRGGHSVTVQMFDGKPYLLAYLPDNMKSVKTMCMREDDVLLCAFPRTGSQWAFEMICMLFNGNAETIPEFKGRRHLEIAGSEVIGALPFPRALNTHRCVSDGPAQVAEKKCKIIYNLRDPKDVAVSLYNMYIDIPFCEYKGDFKDFLYLFLDGEVDCGGIFTHYRDAGKFFSDHPGNPVHIHVYEETIKNPLLEVQKLSDFIGLTRNDDLCQAIAEKCQFSKMQVDKDRYAVKCYGKSIFYRKGVVGDWKNWFTDEMLEDYYRVYEEKMSGSRFYERYAKNKD